MATALSRRPSEREAVLNCIPVARWVLGTVERVLRAGSDDAETWNRCWFAQYEHLGGKSRESGNKGCPRAAARGLWYVGRLHRGQRPVLAWSVGEVYDELTKNAAYAVLAADLLHTQPTLSAASLWPLVQDEFTRLTGVAAAGSEQGEVRLVVALHRCGELVTSPSV